MAELVHRESVPSMADQQSFYAEDQINQLKDNGSNCCRVISARVLDICHLSVQD